MDVSSAKSFVIDDKFLPRSLIYIRTPAIIGNHVEDMLLRKLSIKFNRRPDIPINSIL